MPDDALSAIQKVYEASQREQFLIKLRCEFESVQSESDPI